MALAPEQAGIGIRRPFTTEGVHPYDAVAWEPRTARIPTNRAASLPPAPLAVGPPLAAPPSPSPFLSP